MLGDDVHVEAIFLPLGNDCVLTNGYFKTLRAHYAQSVRHAWGASDIPYAWRAAFTVPGPLSWKRRLLLSGAVTKVHSLWMAQWYIITLGNLFPIMATKYFGANMPHWWFDRLTSLPGPTWHLSEVFSGDFSSPMGPMINVNIAGALVYFCLFPLIVLIIVETLTRPARPAYVTRIQLAGQFLMWPLMAVITFFFASMPALHAQWKLASGKGLIYRVAEKGSRRIPGPAAAAAAIPAAVAAVVHSAQEPAVEPYGAGGGGAS
jgi:hypothetical protein